MTTGRKGVSRGVKIDAMAATSPTLPTLLALLALALLALALLALVTQSSANAVGRHKAGHMSDGTLAGISFEPAPQRVGNYKTKKAANRGGPLIEVQF